MSTAISADRIVPGKPYYLKRTTHNDFISAANAGGGDAQDAYYGNTYKVGWDYLTVGRGAHGAIPFTIHEA